MPPTGPAAISPPRLPWPWLTWPGIGILATGYGLLVVVSCAVAIVHAAVSPEWRTGGADAQIVDTLAAGRDPTLLALLQGISLLGKVWVVAPLVALVGVVAWRRTRSWDAFWLPAAAGAGGLAISVAVKYLTMRPRPPLEVAAVEAFGPSYPSGHVIRVTAVYAALAWLVATWTSRRSLRRVAWLTATAVAGLVGFARLYEAAHWPIDVVVSLGIGTAWLLILLAAGGLLPRPGGGRSPEPAADRRETARSDEPDALPRRWDDARPEQPTAPPRRKQPASRPRREQPL